MKRYIALLRGINISGKNKIPMAELKAKCIQLGYENVLTHLNSGNIIFSTNEQAEEELAESIKTMIHEQFYLDIPVFVIAQKDLKALLSLAPNWWGTADKDIYDNLIFVMSDFTAEMIAEKIGEPSADLEQILLCKNAIFWSFNRAKYAKANWWKKTASAGIAENITVRTANTLRKVADM